MLLLQLHCKLFRLNVQRVKRKAINLIFLLVFEWFFAWKLVNVCSCDFSSILFIQILGCRFGSPKTISKMTTIVQFVLSISFLVGSTFAAMNPLSEIVKKCLVNHQLAQINYIIREKEDDSLYNMVEIFGGNRQQFVGSSNWW